MIVELSQIPEEGLEVDFHAPVRLGVEAAEASLCPVQARIRLFKAGPGVAVRGRFQCTVDVSCSRCLEPFALPIGESFDVQYLPPQALGGEDDAELSGADLDVLPLAEDGIDLAVLLRENLFLSLPVQPVCAEACRGLCARCGANLNAGACGCPPAQPDPRLQILAKLKSGRPSGA